jgi:hypothetical protein
MLDQGFFKSGIRIESLNQWYPAVWYVWIGGVHAPFLGRTVPEACNAQNKRSLVHEISSYVSLSTFGNDTRFKFCWL